MLISTWSTSSARSNCSPTILPQRPPSMPPATRCKGSQQKLASLNAQLAGIAANLKRQPRCADRRNIQDTRMPWQHATRPRAQLAHTIVRAPFAGHRHQRAVAAAWSVPCRRGNRIQHRPRPITSGFRRARRETELNLCPSQDKKVTVEVDTFPGQRWAGHRGKSI